MGKYKERLLRCQKFLAEGDYENLVKELEELKSLNPETQEEAEEALRILEFLISQVEKHQEDIMQKMINYQKFKNYLR